MEINKLKILSSTYFNNGDEIPLGQDIEKWKALSNSKQPAYCHYIEEENQTEHILYNWYALNDKRGILPPGFTLANSEFWKKLESEIEKDVFKCGKREIFGFFVALGKSGFFWSKESDEFDENRAKFFSVLNGTNEVIESECDKRLGLSIVCIKE